MPVIVLRGSYVLALGLSAGLLTAAACGEPDDAGEGEGGSAAQAPGYSAQGGAGFGQTGGAGGAGGAGGLAPSTGGAAGAAPSTGGAGGLPGAMEGGTAGATPGDGGGATAGDPGSEPGRDASTDVPDGGPTVMDGGAPNDGGGIGGAGGISGTGGADGGSSGLDGSGGGGSPHGKFVGNITTNGRVDPNGLRFATYWDQITPENAGKWGSVQSTASSAFNWSTLDAIYDYAEDNGIIFKQHTFVWGNQQPGGTPTEQQVINWIRSFCERYPNTALIDVVNEPPPHTTPNYANNIGGGTNGNWQWITNSFKWARQYCPGAILILNDYSTIEWPNDNQNIINIANAVLANGGPIDAIGAQAHSLDAAGMTPQRVSELLDKLHTDTGLPVYITELDLSYADDQAQLTAYQQYFPLFMDADFVPGITIWGWIYGATWSQSPDSGLVRGANARPAMTWLMGQLGRPAVP